MPQSLTQKTKIFVKSNYKQIKLTITLLITIGFILIVESYIGWQNILIAWQKLPIPVIITAIIFVLFSYFIRAIRIYSYFSLKYEYGLLLSCKLTLLHNFFNNILPMRSGELSFPILLKKYFNIKTLNAVVGLLLFRLLDLHVLLSLLIISSYLILQQYLFLHLIVLLVWLAIPYIIYSVKLSIRHYLHSLSTGKVVTVLIKCLDSLPSNNKKLAIVHFWTTCNWICKLLIFAGILIQFYPMAFEYSLISVIFGDATSVLPIHGVAGAGTYEAGILLGASFFETDTKQLLSAAINLHLFLLGVSSLGAIIAFSFNKLTYKKPKHNTKL